MRVLMYGWEFPPMISGGLGVACYGLVGALLAKHIGVTMVLPYEEESPLHDTDFSLLHTPLTHAHFDIKPISALINPYINETEYQATLGQKTKSRISYGENLWQEVHRYAILAGNFAKTTPHDVIHAHDWLTILAGIRAKKISGKPLIFHVHALEVDRSGQAHNAIFDIEKFGMQQADRIIAVSHYTKNIMVETYGIAPEKISVVYNGLLEDSKLNNPHHAAPKSNPIVLFLGRVTQQKGPYYFIQAAYKILTKRKDIRFIVAGKGDQLSDMIKLTRQLGISEYVQFPGFLDHEHVDTLYAISDVFVMPSVSEPFGIAALEALSHQIPIIISKQSGVSEVLNHVFKVDFWDVDALASKIVAMIDYPALRQTLLKNANKELSQLTWARAANTVSAIYEELR